MGSSSSSSSVSSSMTSEGYRATQSVLPHSERYGKRLMAPFPQTSRAKSADLPDLRLRRVHVLQLHAILVAKEPFTIVDVEVVARHGSLPQNSYTSPSRTRERFLPRSSARPRAPGLRVADRARGPHPLGHVQGGKGCLLQWPKRCRWKINRPWRGQCPGVKAAAEMGATMQKLEEAANAAANTSRDL